MATSHALGFHLMPPVGWLNDPNGLCECNGVFHIFFQYSPKNPNGGEKYWGHYETKDFIEYNYTGPFMSPDNVLDANGVYSGSAYAEDGEMYIYYTGNVKEKGDYDYTYAGRLSNTILVKTKDGKWTDEKIAVLKNKDYPKDLSCHIRDPKVFLENGEYKMVLGARTMKDVGCALLYKSKDKENWEFDRFIESSEPFGFMWECPDIIELNGKKFLSLSPQGVDGEEFRYQNVYQSGYYNLTDGTYDIDESKPFTEWDMGFDFYAPQTFKDESGRYILIGWMGIPDADYTNEPSVNDGWQHTLTMARELYINDKGNVSSKPIEEYKNLREEEIEIKDNALSIDDIAEIECKTNGCDYTFTIDKSLIFQYENGVISLEFDADKEKADDAACGYGRKIRRTKIDEVKNFSIYLDRSAVEIYINDGEMVFSTRYYTNASHHDIRFTDGLDVKAYALKSFKINM
ncbi:MAG: glycoside hydrolase family 32 protein [Lachnospiraceae bacterium]|nr:glycoside hydrolase family 32 protein [Lachnospiraceae bacterium]